MPYTTALLRMKLRGVEVILLQCCTIGKDVVGLRYGILAFLTVERVHEIYERLFAQSLKQLVVTLQRKLLPSHTRYLVLMAHGLKALYLYREYPDAVRIALLRVLAKQLLSDAYSQHRVLQLSYHLVKTSFAKVRHRMTGLSLSREDDAV